MAAFAPEIRMEEQRTRMRMNPVATTGVRVSSDELLQGAVAMQSPLIGNHSLTGLEMAAPPQRVPVPMQDKAHDEMETYLRWRAVTQLAAVGVFILMLAGLALLPRSVSEQPSASVTPSVAAEAETQVARNQLAATPGEPSPEPPSSYP
jgi:hypothetical protein